MRRITGRSIWLGLAAVVLAGCGAAATGSVATPSAKPSGPASSSYGGAVVKTGTATVSGTSETVLTDTQGRTLYYLSSDTATSVRCSGSCASLWPPLLLPSGQPTASGSLPHSLSVVSSANGRQVQYDGHFLYTYSGDSASGQANGNGIKALGGTWYVATPSMSSGVAPATSPSSAGGYGNSGY